MISGVVPSGNPWEECVVSELIRSKESDSSGDLNGMMDFKREKFLWYKKVEGLHGIYVHRHLQASRWVAVNPSPIFSITRTKINIK